MVMPSKPGEIRHVVEFLRAKTDGPPQLSTAYITGELENSIMTDYLGCLEAGSKRLKAKEMEIEQNYGQRLWRKLSDKFIPGQPMGPNTLSDIGKDFAGLLGKCVYYYLFTHCV